MPTLGQAAGQLRISRHTLDKWIERLGIEPLRHQWDLRVFMITDDEVQRIAQARAEMPGRVAQGTPRPFTPSYTPSYTPPTYTSEERTPALSASIADNPVRLARYRSGVQRLAEQAAAHERDKTIKRATHARAGSYEIVDVPSEYQLPPRSIALTAFIDNHRMAESTMRRYVKRGTVPSTRIRNHRGIQGRDLYFLSPEQVAEVFVVWRENGFIETNKQFRECTDPDCPCHEPPERDRNASATRPVADNEMPFPDDGEGQDDE